MTIFSLPCSKNYANSQVNKFLEICKDICFPVSLEKTFWGTNILVFLGLLIDTVNQIVAIPAEKVQRAVYLIEEVLLGRKTTVRKLQKLCGFLNFLCKCIVPGRAFTRRLYAHFSPKMKPHHHVNVNKEMRSDLVIWQTFLNEPTVYCRPYIDYTQILSAEVILNGTLMPQERLEQVVFAKVHGFKWSGMIHSSGNINLALLTWNYML